MRTAARLTPDHPFPGLRPFGAADREFFFGREEQVSTLYRLLDRNRFIAVVGSSGSGKSSLVLAGLLPLLEEERDEPGGRAWLFASLQPGDAPLTELANALGRVADEMAPDARDRETRQERIAFALRRSSFGLGRAFDYIEGHEGRSLLLVVDQFEELFRYARSGKDAALDPQRREEAVRFVQLLLEASRDRTRSIHVLLTMRSDFIGDCGQFYDLPEAVSAAQFLVPSLTRDQREDVIRRPIEKAGGTIDDALVQRLLIDASTGNDQLPVLQHCLARLWQHAKMRAPGSPVHITEDDYKAVHTLSGALSEHADEVMNSPALAGLEGAVEQTFRALSEVDAEGRATRRALRFDQLVAETGVPEEQLRKVLDRFRADDCSFVVPSLAAVPRLWPDTRIDVVHEALLRRWEKITPPSDEAVGVAPAGWLAAEAADGRYYRGLLALIERKPDEQATLPLESVEEREKWWQGRTEAWAARYGGHFARIAQLFAASRAALDAATRRDSEYERLKLQTEIERQVSRRSVAFAVAIGVALLVLAAVTAFAFRSAADAKKQRDLANVQSQRLGQLNAQLASQSKILQQQTLDLQKREKALERQTLELKVLRDRAEGAKNVAQSARGLAEEQRAIAQAQTTIAQQQTKIAQQQRAIALSARERVFLEAGRRALVDDADANDAALYVGAAYMLDPSDRDAQTLLTPAMQQLAMRGTPAQAAGVAAPITHVSYDPAPGAQRLATAQSDGTVALWDGAGRLVRTLLPFGREIPDDAITAFAFDPTGRYLAVGSQAGMAAVVDLGAPRARSALLGSAGTGHSGRVNSVAFSRDGAYLATAGSDGRIILWRSSGGERLKVWNGNATCALFAGSDSSSLVAAMADGSLWRWKWNAEEHGTSLAASGTKNPFTAMAAASDGRYVAAAAGDGSLLVFDANSGTVATIHDSNSTVNSLAFDTAGTHIVTARANGSTHIDGVDGTQLAVFAVRGRAAALDAAENRAGTLVMTRYADGSLALWDVQGKQQLAWFRGLGDDGGVSEGAASAAFSPGGDVLAVGGELGRLSIVSPGNWLLARWGSHAGAVESIAFDPSGRRMLTTSQDGTAALWQKRGGFAKVATLPVGEPGDWVFAGQFNRDGTKVLTVSATASKVWDVAAGTPSLAATIRPTSTDKRFTTAAFVLDDRDVMTIQNGRHPLALTPYTDNRWSIWSLSGAKVRTEDSWDSLPRELQVSGDARYALVFSPFQHSSDLLDLRDGKVPKGQQWVDIGAVALAHDYRRNGYAIGSMGGTVLFISFAGAHRTVPLPTQGHVTVLAFSDDDRWLGVVGGEDKLGKIIDARAVKLHVILQGGTGEIQSFAFAPQGEDLVVTTSDDGAARLWNRDTGVLLGTRWLPGARVTTAVFAPDGATVVLGGSDGSISGWTVRSPLGSPSAAARALLTYADLRNPEHACLLNQAIAVLQGRELSSAARLCQ